MFSLSFQIYLEEGNLNNGSRSILLATSGCFILTAIFVTFEQAAYTVNEDIGMFSVIVLKQDGAVSEQVLPFVLGLDESGATAGRQITHS